MTGTIETLADQFGLKIVDHEGSDTSTDKAGINTPKTETTEKDNTEKDTNEKADKAEVDPRLKDATVGSISDIKDLYQGPEDSQGRAQWLDKYPEDAEEAAENETTEKFALIARKKKCFDGRKKFDLDSIIVQSPDLKKILGKVFDNYPGVTCELDRLIFEAPFEPFVHRWTEFTNAVEVQRAGKAREHLEILHSLLKEELKDVIKALEDYIVHGVTTYLHLWVIFQPGAVVYTRQGGTPKAMSFYSGEYTKTDCGPCYRLCLEPVGWSGKTFGRGTEYINVFSFTGTRAISSLTAFPLSFHPGKETIRNSLVQRGKKYESLAGYHYRSYEGVAMSWDSRGNLVPLTVSGRVVLDAEAFMRFNPQRSERYDELHDEDFTISDVPAAKAKNSRLSKAEANFAEEAVAPVVKLTEDAHLICKSTLLGYSLKLKKWLYFFVDFVGEIQFNSKAFDTLVLPTDTKEMLMGFVESQVVSQNTFDDVIQGKGKGIIMLLSGPPGVGKTLTAESVAESMNIPLYMMSAGDLGTEPHQVEYALQNILEMVAKWNAILLLDECDVFLEARTSHDLERNKLVSIFLRTLEYYEGILFLTTNRVSNMDAAFQSRIHVSMAYPNLTSSSRRQIWENFLATSKQKSEISEKDLDDLSEFELNGRQIKNVLKTAFLISVRKRMPLKKEFIETVLAIEGRRPELA